jgi:hypothetical protein
LRRRRRREEEDKKKKKNYPRFPPSVLLNFSSASFVVVRLSSLVLLGVV